MSRSKRTVVKVGVVIGVCLLLVGFGMLLAPSYTDPEGANMADLVLTVFVGAASLVIVGLAVRLCRDPKDQYL